MKLAASVLFIFATWSAYAQEIFVGKNVDLLFGLRVIARAKPASLQQYPYRGFFTKITNKMSPHLGGGIPYEKMQGDTFVCVSINPRGKTLFDDFILLNLVRQKGDTIYYYHDTRFQSSFELTVLDPIKPALGYYCKEITKKVDKFDDSIIWFSALSEPVVYTRHRTAGGDSWSLSLSTIAALPDRGSDVILLLMSGARLSMTCPMDITVTRDAQYKATSSCSLSQDQLAVLASDPIASFRTFIYTEEVKNPERFSDMLRCLLDAK